MKGIHIETLMTKLFLVLAMSTSASWSQTMTMFDYRTDLTPLGHIALLINFVNK